MARVDHLSYSAILTFLRNQVEFQKRYIAKVWDNPKSPSMIVGTAFHKALEEYYRNTPMQEAITIGLREIEITSDYEIDYGKTGNRQKMIQEYTTLVNKYFEECPAYEVVDVEKRLESSVNGVPMVGVIDLVIRKTSGIALIDHKTVSFYSPEDEENYKYLLQGYIYLVLAENEYGEKIESVAFNEVKKSINRDGTPQRREVVYDRNSLLAFAPVAQKIITNVFSYVNDDNAKFFPNPSDQLNGMASMELVSNMEEGFEAARVKRKVNVADRFAPRNVTVDIDEATGSNEDLILRKFIEFGIGGVIGTTYTGPSTIRYTFKPNRGIAMRAVASRSDDLAIALKSHSVRIEAPIPGTDLVGIEVPNSERYTVNLESEHMHAGTMDIPIGVTVEGRIVYKSLADMPHLLIAGATGSGKSVMLNVILHALKDQMPADKLRLVLIDPKQVELVAFSNLTHTDSFITDPLGAVRALAQLVDEMERRYKVLAKAGVRGIDEYSGKMPKIVVVVDEFADLMMSDIQPSVASMDIKAFKENLEYALMDSSTGRITQKAVKFALKETLEKDTPPSAEESIIRIAQKARAVGIHLILATQRPSADVVTGLIKANIPTKIAFMTTSAINSRIILDTEGAEKLTGKGDMLFLDPAKSMLTRLQGLYI